MNSYIFLSLLSVVCNTVYTSVAYNRLKRNDELTLSVDQMHSQEKNSNQTFIVGGVDAKLGDIPGIVAQNGGNRVCGGSIINKRTIMTAAHCPQGLKASEITVRAGSLYFDKGGLTYNVTSIIIHPYYNKPTRFNNDIGLLILSTDIAIDNKTIAAVKLPANGSDPAPGSPVQVAGWGTTMTSGNISNKLKKVNTTIYDRDDCQKLFQSAKLVITKNMICAGTLNGGKNACHGDSGGPLLSGKIQVGIVSAARYCEKEPLVYVRVGNYIDFITANKAKV